MVHSLPDPACTPGDVGSADRGTDDLDVICHSSTKPRRHVTAEQHRQAFIRYGLRQPAAALAKSFEVDHFIPLELGGSNADANLWAEPAGPVPGYHEKDHVEDYLHKQVCSGEMNLADARRAITTDWVSVWRKIGGGTGDDDDDQE